MNKGDDILPPTPKYTREQILLAAYDLVREKGCDALTARDLGAKLGTSATPIFTAFENMEDLKNEVLKKAKRTFEDYQKAEIERNEYPKYKAMGMAYIKLAKEEKNIFKLLFMRDRSNEDIISDNQSYAYVLDTVRAQTNFPKDKADRFHAEMWIAVHGIATMIATSYLELNIDIISGIITDIYNGLKRGYEE